MMLIDIWLDVFGVQLWDCLMFFSMTCIVTIFCLPTLLYCSPLLLAQFIIVPFSFVVYLNFQCSFIFPLFGRVTLYISNIHIILSSMFVRRRGNILVFRVVVLYLLPFRIWESFGMAEKSCVKRLQKEYRALCKV